MSEISYEILMEMLVSLSNCEHLWNKQFRFIERNLKRILLVIEAALTLSHSTFFDSTIIFWEQNVKVQNGRYKESNIFKF